MRAIPHTRTYTLHWVAKIAASIAASTLVVVSASLGVAEKSVAGGLTVKRFAGQTVTIALPGGMKTGLLLYRDNWERQTGAKVKVIASD
jgi:hypothetical protein